MYCRTILETTSSNYHQAWCIDYPSHIHRQQNIRFEQACVVEFDELGKLRAIGPDARDLFPINRTGSGSLEVGCGTDN